MLEVQLLVCRICLSDEEEDQSNDNPEPEADPSGGGSVNQTHEQMTMCVKL